MHRKRISQFRPLPPPAMTVDGPDSDQSCGPGDLLHVTVTTKYHVGPVGQSTTHMPSNSDRHDWRSCLIHPLFVRSRVNVNEIARHWLVVWNMFSITGNNSPKSQLPYIFQRRWNDQSVHVAVQTVEAFQASRVIGSRFSMRTYTVRVKSSQLQLQGNPLVVTNSSLLKRAVEIVDLP